MTDAASLAKIQQTLAEAVATDRYLADHVDNLTRELRAEKQWRRWALRTAAVLSVVIVLLAVVVVAAFVWALRSDHAQQAQRALIVECVTPSTPGHVHPCADRGAAAQIVAITQLETGLAKIDQCIADKTVAQVLHQVSPVC